MTGQKATILIILIWIIGFAIIEWDENRKAEEAKKVINIINNQ